MIPEISYWHFALVFLQSAKAFYSEELSQTRTSLRVLHSLVHQNGKIRCAVLLDSVQGSTKCGSAHSVTFASLVLERSKSPLRSTLKMNLPEILLVFKVLLDSYSFLLLQTHKAAHLLLHCKGKLEEQVNPKRNNVSMVLT